MNITLQFSTSKGIGSKLIQWESWSAFSHVDLCLPDGTLLGARMDGGVQIRPANYKTFTKVKRLTATVGDAQGQQLYALAKQQVGKPYQTKSIFGFVIRKDVSSTGSFFCSELIAWLFDNIGYPLTYKKVNEVSPGELAVSPRLRPEGT